ncbi:hypothetical protein HYH03_001256 [Edaphochlamys debaryana]|uniref:Uncharacterized protein n=1 Tax=Edaphochlamys debaryana TaxID=47281 RepID=A0A836C6S7_9CHLO|nr:hypothetical protein HYH03_001256 [Edaphochlamys debaryana]|eukprot:KAG2501478.1 hypothetical protein HYH03_001256 [Edaphochlamys debaryana]
MTARGASLRRGGSEGNLQPAALVLDPPGTLKTSPSTYVGALVPDRKKFANVLTAQGLRCPARQPRSPCTPPGATMEAPWLPFQRVPLPPQLVFETWWNERQGAERALMHVTYDTVTRECLAGTNVSLAMTVTTSAGEPIDEYDMHVGAELVIAGRKVTLRKCATLATLTWLDQQARAMLVAKYRLEEELSKFRPVVPVPAQYEVAQRAERFDLQTHQHLPSGGRLCLRALFHWVMGLAEQLRQHRASLPPVPDAIAGRVSGAVEALPGPPDWSPETKLDRRVSEALQRQAEVEAERAASAAVEDWRQDLPQWLNSIPLAASCVTSYSKTAAAQEAVEAAKAAAQREKERSGTRGHGGGGRGPLGLSLAFNASVVSRLGGTLGGMSRASSMALLSSRSPGPGGATARNMFAAGPAPGGAGGLGGGMTGRSSSRRAL